MLLHILHNVSTNNEVVLPSTNFTGYAGIGNVVRVDGINLFKFLFINVDFVPDFSHIQSPLIIPAFGRPCKSAIFHECQDYPLSHLSIKTAAAVNAS